MKKSIVIGILSLSISTLAYAKEVSNLASCSKIKDNQARLLCFDKVSATHSQKEASKIILPQEKILNKEEKFGLSKKIIAQKIAEDSTEALYTSVKQIESSLRGLKTFYLKNGQVWQQTESNTIRIKAGDEIKIARASLNSFLLKKTTANASTRVKRLK